jgi:hypothetical protein
MSADQAKKLAQKFIEDQKRILEEYGDSVVKSKCKDAVASVQEIFKAIASRPAARAKAASQAKS